MKAALLLLGLSCLSGCASKDLPPGSGEGIVSFDREPPPGAEVFPEPDWRVGDRFAYALGAEAAHLGFAVVESTEAGYQLRSDDGGLLLHYTRALQETAEDVLGSAPTRMVKDPFDAPYHWPLWVGKRWACHFLRKTPGQPAVSLAAQYHCDHRETIATPAGSFDCLRIWRSVRVFASDSNRVFTTVAWYSPEVGFFVRRLADDSLWELKSVIRNRE